MKNDYNILKENKKRYPRFKNFGEVLFYSYANLQMLQAAISMKKESFDRTCYMVRAKAFKAYKEGRWTIHDLFEENVAKMKFGNYCWYCGKEFENKWELTADHVFPRSKGGINEMDNIIMVCKHCNSSKQDKDLLEWYFDYRHEFPPLPVLAHYLKQIYLYAKKHELLEKTMEELDAAPLPFNYKYIPLDYPQPRELKIFILG